jgi:hypothetical protein
MNTLDRSHSETEIFSIEELEARFEMEALNVPAGIMPGLDWKCSCTFES